MQSITDTQKLYKDVIGMYTAVLKEALHFVEDATDLIVDWQNTFCPNDSDRGLLDRYFPLRTKLLEFINAGKKNPP